jgi:PAS domain S-box-containing protein
MKLRSHLVALVVAMLVPVLLLAGALTVLLTREERETAQRGLAETTRALEVALDREVGASIATLQALATSEHLDRADFRAFHEYARRVLPSQRDWYAIILIDAVGRASVLTTAQPFGAPSPALASRPHIQRVIATRTPQASDLVQGIAGDRRFISVAVPVVRGDRVPYVVAALYDVDALSNVLARVKLPAEWTGAVLDRNAVIIGRTRQPEQFIGQPATAGLAARVAAAGEGVFEDVNKEGVPNLGAFARSTLTGWTVVVGAPSATLYASLRRSLTLVVGGGIALLALGAAVALVYGRRITAPVMALAESAAAFGRGVPPPPVASTVDEVAVVSQTIAAAAAERLRAEAEILEAKQALEALIEAAPIAIIVLDRDGVTRRWNRAAEAMFGWTAEEVVGTRGLFVPEERRGEFVANLERTIAGRPITGLETERQRRDGVRIPVRLFTAAVSDAHGRPHQTIALVEDITERKRAEERAAFLAEAAVVLSSSLDYPRVLAALARLAVPRLAEMCAVDVVEGDRRIQRVALVHVDPDKEAAARELRERFGFSEDSLVARVLQSGRPVVLPDVPDATLAARARSAEELALLRRLEINSAIVVPLVARGTVVGAITLIASGARRYQAADLTLAAELAERAGAAVDNARLYRAAQEANAAKDEFLATLSHELRTPLNAVYGWARMLRVGQVQPAMTEHALSVIERNAQAQMRLIEELLDVSRIVTGKMRLDAQPVDLGAVITATLDAIRPAAEAKEIRVQSAIDATGDLVTGDPARLQQVVWNLLSNAVKSTPKGGRVDVGLRRVDAHVELTVRDTGEGIRADLLPHIFERFRQGDSSPTRVHGGLGIGLALVRHLVELHGGTVAAESAGEGQGATFRVTLPIAAARAAMPGGPRLTGLSVVVVDDAADALALMATILTAAGATVHTASSAKDAERMVAAIRPDVLVSDIEMPGADGYALIRALRALPPDEGGATPAIAVTAYGGVADRVRTISSGFDNHLPKPIDPAELVAVVARAAGRR